MKIEHLALWVQNLELMKDFYVTYFNMKSNTKYVNHKKRFSSYFLSFKGGARIELMHRPDIPGHMGGKGLMNGQAHFAISIGSKDKVDQLTEVLRNDGFEIIGEPRTTGDGYYESVVSDPEGNHIELTE
ncbi:VOC family protein [Ulvibacterium sp.]|uniref:VOC family protein n=1 Tax=Ulvibacterium sp. TaxID=2665914 RepID=UPI00261F670E|nr:VOC family protein [Ulvibacterium sp.]